MRMIRRVSDYLERVLTAPGEELGRWARFVRFQWQLWRFCFRRLWENNVAAMSAALSFRTIFAMVPAMVLVVLVLKGVGVLEDGKQSLRGFLEASGVTQITVVPATVEPSGKAAATTKPTSADAEAVNVADEIERVVARVESKLTFRRIGPIGVALLIWTALTLLTTMERSLNRIFGATRPRPLGRRLLLYWSVLTLGPMAWITAGYAGGQAIASAADVPGVSWLVGVAGWLGPAIVGIFVIAAVYQLLPHTDVRFRAAVGGAVVAVPVWLVAKWAFAIYVTRLVGTGNLYGALGLLPLFLVWMNLSWTVFLFGAELANAAANVGGAMPEDRVGDETVDVSDRLAVALTVADAFSLGRGPVPVDVIGQTLGLSHASVQASLDYLTQLGVVCPSETDTVGGYLLARPTERVALLELLGVGGGSNGRAAPNGYDARTNAMMAQAWSRADAGLGDVTLADLLRRGGGDA